MNDYFEFKKKIQELVKAWNNVIKPGIEESGQYGETNTRKYLLDPVLEALNWVDDGSKKIIDNEFSIKHKTGTGSADYALKVNGIPKILIEAKDVAKVKDLENGYDIVHGIKRTYPRQLSNYCHDLNHLGFDIKFAILTNGKEWILYNMQYADISSEREIVFRLDIEGLDKDENLKKLWALEYNDFCGDYHRLREIIQQLHDYRLGIDKKAVQQLLECKDLLSNSILTDYEKNIRGTKTQIDKILEDEETVNGMPVFKDIPDEERLNFFIKEASSSIINKILFIRILEDRNFLTPKLTKRSIEKWKDFWGHKDYNEIMNLFREACRVTENTYNGGLFRLNPYDEVNYDPDVIKKIIDILGDISFREIDSDIIGRIYEIYLGHVLKVESEIRGKKRTRYQADNKERKKLGQYYTPKFVVDFIVKNTLGKLIEGKKPEDVSKIRILDPACGSGSFLINAYDTLAEYFENWNSEILKKIAEKNRESGAKITNYQDTGSIPNFKNIILKDNIHGVDLNDLSVQICEINLWLRALERDKKLIKLNKNILHGNSLITGVEGIEELSLYTAELEDIKKRQNQIKEYYDKDELTREENKRLEALEKNLKFNKEKINTKLNENLKNYFGFNVNVAHPFNWEVEFPQVMKEGGFDVVIGNPPYVNLANIEDEKVRCYFQKNYETAENKSDLFAFFTELISKKLLKNGSYFGFIVSSTWTNLKSFHNMRKILLDNFLIESLVPLDLGTFTDANVKPIIFILKKESNLEKRRKNLISIYNLKDNQFIKTKEIPQKIFFDDINHIFNLDWNPKSGDLLTKLKYDTTPLGTFIEFMRGTKTSNNNKFIIDYIRDENCKPVLRGRDIQRYNINDPKLYIWYLPDEMKKKVGSVPQNPKLYEVDKKIILQGRSGNKIIATIDSKKYYCIDTTYVGKIKDLKGLSLNYFLALLNSKLINYWYGVQFRTSTISGYELDQVPVKIISKPEQKPFINSVEKLLFLKENFNSILKEYSISITNHPISDIKSCHFGRYFDNYDLYNFHRETFNKINEIKTKILFMDIKEEGQKLKIVVTLFDESKNQLRENITAIELTIEDEDVRKFLFLSLKKAIDDKGGKGFGTGNILNLIKKIYVPFYVTNAKMNIEKIREIMKEFNHSTKDIWWKSEDKKEKFNSLTEMEDKIEKTNREIDELVYKLYGITEDEKKIIEDSLK